MGYHKRRIDPGTYGEISKIREELEELEDSADQGVKILVLCELADMYGAIEAYAEKCGATMEDLRQMSNLTKESFRDGSRTPRIPG